MDKRNHRIRIATLLSVLVHVGLVTIPISERPPQPPAPMQANVQGPMTVRIVGPDLAAQVQAPPPSPEPARPPQPQKTPQILAAKPQTPVPPDAARVAPPPETPTPTPMPTFDMAAMIAATRERRRQYEAAARAGAAGTPGPEDSGAKGLQRNIQTLSRNDGPGGVFQILRKGERTAEFAFNGWQGDSRRWREVIEVDAGSGGDVDRAIIRRMIALIRSHYSGDFRWESHLRGRVIVLSARVEDNEALEDFLMREFFGTPVIRRPP